ncbi:hypothetical protein BU15DRAFT_86204 [Melanogaster broomeanus]|nr:hypothetical protein BU15DRAFT_86204 [Melanogaster broomeanus]
MKGFTKAIKRTPHLVTAKSPADPEFDDYNLHFVSLEQATEKLLKDTKAFTDAVTTMLTGATGFASHYNTIFSLGDDLNLASKHPQVQSSNSSRVVLLVPSKSTKGVLRVIRKTITKRDHKLTDYDRFNNSLTKLRDKKEKSLSDEKNLFKLEQDFEIATNEYDYINNALKQDLPRFMQLTAQFIDPLFHSFIICNTILNFCNVRLNIYYLFLEKMQSLAEGQYDVTNCPGSQIQSDYENNRTDAWSQIEDLNITKRMVSTGKFVQSKRTEGGGFGSSLGRSPSVATTTSAASSASRSMPPPTRAAPSFVKKAPPPPPGQHAAPPPPYSATNNGTTTAATKRPPPPPPLKPKPKLEPAVEYVTALYDFDAQAAGDLSFKTGDRIEIVTKTESQEDWWTGRLNGEQGVFPGNYVQS